jgi:peptide deformylase
MALRPIVKYPHSVLTTRSVEVATIDESIERLVADMVETMHAAPGVGLAANQVDVTLRVDEEGCLSIPGITELVSRPLRAEIEALNLAGKRFRVTGEGLMARALLHEIDHLDGILFLDRLSPLKRRLLRKKIQKLIRTGEWAGVGT